MKKRNLLVLAGALLIGSGALVGCGGGKTPVMPNYVISQNHNKVILRNFEGVITTYDEPDHYTFHCDCDVCTGKTNVHKVGVAGLLNGETATLEPEGLERKQRGHH